MDNRINAYVVLLTPLLLQFVTVPQLGSIDSAGKLFVFAFIVIITSFAVFSPSSVFKFHPVLSLLAVSWLVLFVLGFFSLYPYWTFLQLAILAAGYLFLLLATWLFARDDGYFKQFVDGLLFTGVLASVLGLYEFFHFSLLGPTGSMLIPYLLPPDRVARVAGIYGQPNFLAAFLSVVMLAFFLRYVHFDLFNEKRNTSLLRFVPFVLVALVYFQTNSKAGLLSMGLIVCVLAWLVASGRYLQAKKTEKQEFIKLIGCLLLAFVFYQMLAHTFVLEKRAFDIVSASTDARFIFWTSAVLIFLDYPLTGVGLGNYRFLQNSYGLKSHDVLGFVQYESMGNTNWAHNELLQILCEGGILPFAIFFFLLILFIYFFCKKFLGKKTEIPAKFLYSHVFLFPFFIQSSFSYIFRSPPLLILFLALLGLLVSQYPLKDIHISAVASRLIRAFLFVAFCFTLILFFREISIGTFSNDIRTVDNVEKTIPHFTDLEKRPYSQFRVLLDGVPFYVREALIREDDALAIWLLPYCERLAELEGARWQWFQLAHIYLKVGLNEDARIAIQRTIDLMPTDEAAWAFLHYLNMLKHEEETGRPLEVFGTDEQKIDFTGLEQVRD